MWCGKNVFWARPSVHAYTEKETVESQNFPDGRFVYTPKGSTAKHFAKIEEQLNTATSVEEKTDILTPYLNVTSKNRFFLPVPPEKKENISRSNLSQRRQEVMNEFISKNKSKL